MPLASPKPHPSVFLHDIQGNRYKVSVCQQSFGALPAYVLDARGLSLGSGTSLGVAQRAFPSSPPGWKHGPEQAAGRTAGRALRTAGRRAQVAGSRRFGRSLSAICHASLPPRCARTCQLRGGGAAGQTAVRPARPADSPSVRRTALATAERAAE